MPYFTSLQLFDRKTDAGFIEPTGAWPNPLWLKKIKICLNLIILVNRRRKNSERKISERKISERKNSEQKNRERLIKPSLLKPLI